MCATLPLGRLPRIWLCLRGRRSAALFLRECDALTGLCCEVLNLRGRRGGGIVLWWWWWWCWWWLPLPWPLPAMVVLMLRSLEEPRECVGKPGPWADVGVAVGELTREPALEALL